MKYQAQDARSAGQELLGAMQEVLTHLTGQGDGPSAPDLCEEMAAYAWSGVLPGACDTTLDERMHEICVVDELLAGSFINPTGDGLLSDDSRNLLKHVITAATARKTMDEGHDMTIEQLAALAGVTERTVRGATSSTNPDPLPITKDGHWTYIRAEDALAWLSNRSDFQPTQNRAGAPSIETLSGARPMGEIWQHWRQTAGHSIDDLARELKWKKLQTSAYMQLEQCVITDETIDLSPSFWRDLARCLDAADPDSVAALTYQRLLVDFARQRTQVELALQ